MTAQRKLTPPPHDNLTGQANTANFKNDLNCWRSFCEDLIYAGAFGTDVFLFQFERRVRWLTPTQRTWCVRAAEGIKEFLDTKYPDAPSRLARAQAAWRDRDATLYACTTWLPKRPPGRLEIERGEREHRAGISEDQRQANADALAQEIVPPSHEITHDER